MTQSKRLAAHRARVSAEDPSPDNEPEDTETRPEDEEQSTSEGGNQKESYMNEEEHKAAIASAKAEAAAEANQRFSAVIASEHYAGREKLAHALLANDKMSADEIISALAAAEPAKPQASDETDPEAAARAEMQNALAETANSNIDSNGGGKPDKKADVSAVWDQAIQANNPGVKLG